MKFLRSAVVAACLFLTLGAAAPPVEDPEGTLVEALVVAPRTPGPAWWKVSDGDTTVWILAMPEGGLPPGVAWDQSVVARRLKGANSLIQGASMTAGVRDIPALLKLRGQLRSKTPLEASLPPALRDRFVADRTRLGKPAKRYAEWSPLAAGLMLMGDSRAKGRWGHPDNDVRRLAKKAKVPLRSGARYDAVPFLRKALAGLTPAIQQQCLESALDDIDDAGRVRPAAQGWARGDVRSALSGPRAFERCVLLLSGGGDIWRRASRDQTQDIAEALKKPGHSVALVGLRRLLAQDGVLAQLRARGLTVTGPGDAAP
ncbi:hypothetical protein QO010_002655 [Caulobacter ginsengisoli]|uniref:TraB/GumN family protein n=1 Tax=Caulobacter ginsengisoli TaxID=400775 RepID=A0ABU0IS91_9CAUL|nr:TraB/GumN family protein [Caulobacter ginsengisoli]MDQ0464871.1 hypothetical protein [Caulobacter ginsengisoli]